MSRSLVAILLVFAFVFSFAACKSVSTRRNEYAADLQTKLPSGCKVTPQLGRIMIDCDGASDTKAAADAVFARVQQDCSSLPGAGIDSVLLSSGKGSFRADKIRDGKCGFDKE
jgi:hypothetical protein